MAPLRDLYHQLADRGVLRVGALYIAVSWMAIESGDILLPLFDVSEDSFRWLVIVLFAGFPVAITLAWVFEVTDKGIVVDDDTQDERTERVAGRGVDFVVIGVLLVALGFSLFMNVQTAQNPGIPTVMEPMAVVIADFANTTGEPLLGGALEQALQIGLEGASFIATLPRQHAVEIALRLRPDAVGLDPEVARLVAVREGVRLVLSGDAKAEGDGYSVSVTAIESQTGETIVEVTDEAPDKLSVLEAVARLSREIREELGDVTIEDDSPLEAFTASSLEAINHYLTAQKLGLTQKFSEAVEHYAAAVEEDPNFGRAWSGWALSAFEMGNQAEAERLYAEALKHLGNMSERERLRTTGHYFAVANQNYPKAIDTYRELTQKYPADDAAFNNLAVAAFLNRQFEVAFQAGASALELFPRSSLYQGNLALYAMYSGRFEEATRRAGNLLEDQPEYSIAYLPLAAGEIAAGNYTAAAAHYNTMQIIDPRGRSIGAMGLADLALYRGELDAGAAMLKDGIAYDLEQDNHYGAATKQLAMARTLIAQGDASGGADMARGALQTSSAIRVRFEAGLAFAAAGQPEATTEQASSLGKELSREARAYKHALDALVAFQNQRYADAMDAIVRGKDLADLWWLQYLAGLTYLEIDLYPEAFSEFDACRQRIGEASAIFLDDQPTWRYNAELDYWLGRSQQGLDMQEEAIASFSAFVERVQREYPRVADARERISALERAASAVN